MKRAIIIAAACLALAGAFILLRPKPLTPSTPSATPSAASTSNAPTVSETFTVTDGTVDGPTTVNATAGDVVALSVTSDTAGMVHLHGYEVIVDVPAGGTETLTVTTDQLGRFSVEFHGEGTQAQITELEVTP